METTLALSIACSTSFNNELKSLSLDYFLISLSGYIGVYLQIIHESICAPVALLTQDRNVKFLPEQYISSRYHFS